MGFAQGNQLWKDGLKSKKEKEQKILDMLFGDLGEGGAEAYGDKLEKLSNSKSLSDEEKEFMDRYEKLLEFHRHKLARSEVDVTSKGEQMGVVVLPSEDEIPTTEPK